MTLESLITLGYYVSSIGFLVAAVIMWLAVKKFGKSSLGSAFYYFFVGTAIFFVITIFQKLGGEFFGIEAESMDVWWHLMFYMAFFFYYLGIKFLVSLGSSESQSAEVSSGRMLSVVAAIILVVIFIIPSWADGVVTMYLSTPLAALGLHHFLSFLFAVVIGSYLFSAKKNLGQIGKTIANPMIIVMWAFAAQHFWELQFESWKTVIVTSEIGEGGEKIFLIIAAVCVSYAAWRLKSFAKST